MLTSNNRIRLTGLLVVMIPVLAGCADSAAAPVVEESSLAALSSTEQSRLATLEAAERHRVERARETTRIRYDSLESAWQGYRDAIHSNTGDRVNGDQAQVIECEPLPYAADVKVVGPAGGIVTVGPHKLMIPRGALTRYEVITAEIPVALHVAVKFSPSGLRFLKPAMLLLNYRHCRPPEGSAHRVAYVNDAAEILEWPSSFDDPKQGLLFGTIDHFSKYAVASN
jgi:hypothetical protein